MIRGHESSGGGNCPDRRGPGGDADGGVVAEGGPVPAGRDVHDDDPGDDNYLALYAVDYVRHFEHDYRVVRRVDYDNLVAALHDYEQHRDPVNDDTRVINAAADLVYGDNVIDVDEHDGGPEEGVRV